MEKLAGRVAVVTGGASGIGLGLARRFLTEGMKVVIADMDAAALDAALAELSPLGEVMGQRTDVAKPDQLHALADAAVARFGAVHILVNNAGVGGFQRFENTNPATWDWILGVNLMGVINGSRIFLPILAAQDEAHIVNTSSMSGFLATPYHHPYNVSKAGVVAFSEGLYLEFQIEKPHVGVSVLCPGLTATNILDDQRNAPAGHAKREETDPDLDSIRDVLEVSLTGGMKPDVLADCVIEGIRDRRLYMFSHPEWLAQVEARMASVLGGTPLNNPFGSH